MDEGEHRKSAQAAELQSAVNVSALILAAGRSVRMGQPKMLLPWGETTVLGRVIDVLRNSGIEEILVVTGGARKRVEELAAGYGIRVTHNAGFESGGMLSSLQCGLRALEPPPGLPYFLRNRGGRRAATEGVLIVLGDQPQIEARSVRAVASRFEETGASLVVPSYRMRRGHPWLVARPLWAEIEALSPPQTPRDFLNRHAAEIEYVDIDTPSILADLDTPEDYLKSRP